MPENPTNASKGAGRITSSYGNRGVGVTHLLIIGIDKYEECPRLYNAVKDAKAFRDVLIQHYQFKEEHTISLFDEEATQIRIFQTLSSLVHKVKPEDNLLIYFSGHGEYEENIKEGYWIPVEGQLSHPGTYISNSRIIKYLQAIKSHHTFLIVDSCFAGSLFVERKILMSERLESQPSRWLLTSGQNEVVSDGRPGDHSPFAASILSYLKHNQASSIPVTSLISNVIETTIFNAYQTPRGEPIRNVGHEGGQFFFHRNQGFEQSSISLLNNQSKPVTEAKPKKKAVLKAIPISLFLVAMVAGYSLLNLLQVAQKKQETQIIHGFNPYWMGSSYEYHNYKLWDRISYFSYDINPTTGAPMQYGPLRQLEESRLVEFAHDEANEVLITITAFGQQRVKTFLENKSNQQDHLIDSLRNLLIRTQADGITIDFEWVPKELGLEFSNFIEALHQKLNPNTSNTKFKKINKKLAGEETRSVGNKNYLIQVILPSVGEKTGYQVGKLKKYVDHFLFMYPSPSTSDTIDSPGILLSSNEDGPSMEESIDYYLEAGINPEKLLMGLSTFGSQWNSKSNIPFTVSEFYNHITYRQIIADASSLDSISYNEDYTSAYLTKSNLGDTIHPYTKIWFDDSTTLTQKYRWAQQKGLGGVSVWALGYDGMVTTLEDALREQKANGYSSGAMGVFWVTLLLISLLGIVFWFYFRK